MFSNFLRSFRSLGAMFVPPFDGLWLLCTLYFFWTFLIFPHSPVIRGEFPDTDDYMYLTQLLDWLSGQGWYDNVQHRLDPPHGVPIHFSRIAMLPMAAIVKLIELIGLGPKGAATIMAIVYPVMLLGLLFGVMRWVAKSFMPKEWAGVTAYVGLFATATLNLYQPGHVDHHGLNIILLATALGCVARMMQRPEQHRWPCYAGLLLALSLTVALEALPWILLLSAFLGLWAIIKAGNAARSGLLYSLNLFVGSAVGLLVTRPPSDLFNLDVLAYSVVYVILAGAIVIAFAGVYLTARAPLAVRFILGGLLAAGAGAWFLHRFPELISGPYGGIDPALVHIILDEITEAQPLREDSSWYVVFLMTASSFVALPAALRFWWQARGTQKWLWSLQVVFLVAAMGLTYFYQRRFIGIMNMLAIVPLAVLMQRGWVWIGANWRGRRQVFAEIALILLVGPLPVIMLPALDDNRSFNIGFFLFPVSIGAEQAACGTYQLENALRDPTRLGNKPRLIMNTLGLGPELLFRTPHKVLAAPYHMDVEGNVDSTRFFSTPYPEEAEAIARRRGVDLVVACVFVENFYFHVSPFDGFNVGGLPGQDFAPHFIERLVKGHIPSWLRPVKIPGLSNFVVYEVLPPESASKIPVPHFNPK